MKQRGGMNRMNLLKGACFAVGSLTIGGAILYIVRRDADILDDHWEGIEKVLSNSLGKKDSGSLTAQIQREYEALAVDAPDIGGDTNMFSEWLTYGVFYLAVYRILKAQGRSLEEAGKMIFDTFVSMADYPKWLLCLVGSFKYGDGYLKRLKEAVSNTQARRYPGDWVATFIEGDGEEFDYGIDIAECGICKRGSLKGGLAAPLFTPTGVTCKT